jgi:hypothetical protein
MRFDNFCRESPNSSDLRSDELGFLITVTGGDSH